MVRFELDKDVALSKKEKDLLNEAKNKLVVYDEDSPRLTNDMEKAFMEARKEKPYHGEPITLYVSPETIMKAKSMGSGYISILGKLLDKAVSEYRVV